MITFTLETISPAVAKQYLERNKKNRAITKERVSSLPQQLKNGKAGSEFVIPASGCQLGLAGVRKRREPLAGCFQPNQKRSLLCLF